jgi:hypothetical protein
MADVQKNAADPAQVKAAEKKEMFRREDQLNDLRKILSMKEGRRVLWRLLEQCRVFASVWEPSAKIHYNSGRQDLGHFIVSEIVEANDEAYLQMMREQKTGEFK